MNNKKLSAICFITSTACFGIASVISIMNQRMQLFIVYSILSILMLIVSVIIWKNLNKVMQ